MKYKIIVDSSSNLDHGFIKDENIGFDIAPLSLQIDQKEYLDDGTIDIDDMLAKMHASKAKSTSSCPSVDAYLSRLCDAEYFIIITISSKLSGSYNSALVAKSMYKDPSKVFVVDSKLVCGAMQILATYAKDLINEGKPFIDITNLLIAKRDTINLLFVLDKFDNFIKSGRVPKIVGFLASKLAIKPLCFGEDGEIKIKAKIRTFKAVLKKLVLEIATLCPETAGRTCIISHTKNLEGAKFIKEEVEKLYHFKEVKIEDNRALCSFYALEGGIIVSF